MGPGLLESSERTARCGCGAMRPALVWIGGALAFEERWLGELPSTQRTGWMTSMNDLARELSEVQGLDQSHELETRVPPCLIMHATERYPPR